MKSVEGIWSLELYGTEGWETRGILILDNGRCIGGARNHFKKGTYLLSGQTIEITLNLEYFGKVRILFGSKDRKFSTVIEGKHKAGEINGKVYRPDKNTLGLQCRLKLLSDLK